MPNYYVVVKDENGNYVDVKQVRRPFSDKSLADAAAMLLKASDVFPLSYDIHVEQRD